MIIHPLYQIKIDDKPKIENHEVLIPINNKPLFKIEHNDTDIDLVDTEKKGFEILIPISGNLKNKEENEFLKGFQNIEKKEFEKKMDILFIEPNERNIEQIEYEKNKEIFTILKPIGTYSQFGENKNEDDFSKGMKQIDKIKIEKEIKFIEFDENKKNLIFEEKKIEQDIFIIEKPVQTFIQNTNDENNFSKGIKKHNILQNEQQFEFDRNEKMDSFQQHNIEEIKIKYAFPIEKPITSQNTMGEDEFLKGIKKLDKNQIYQNIENHNQYKHELNQDNDDNSLIQYSNNQYSYCCHHQSKYNCYQNCHHSCVCPCPYCPIPGPIGPRGPQGFTGNTGTIGPQGFTGDVGPQGFTGDVGPQGFTGDIGPLKCW
jgi:hypothetical protein